MINRGAYMSYITGALSLKEARLMLSGRVLDMRLGRLWVQASMEAFGCILEQETLSSA